MQRLTLCGVDGRQIKQRRHEILKRRSAPRQHTHAAAVACIDSAEAHPCRRRYLTERDSDIVRRAALAHIDIIKAAVELAARCVYARVHQPALERIEYRKVRAAQQLHELITHRGKPLPLLCIAVKRGADRYQRGDEISAVDRRHVR